MSNQVGKKISESPFITEENNKTTSYFVFPSDNNDQILLSLYYKDPLSRFLIYSENKPILRLLLTLIKLIIISISFIILYYSVKIKNFYSKINKIIFNEYEENIDFSNNKTDIKVIALYLPQYYAFKENNEFWGEGFTEWTNVKKAKPVFENHNQPRVPHESIGYYNLTLIEDIIKQVNLAKQHGIYGFGIYYYWFSGKRLLDKPLDLLLLHKEIDFHYLLIWANEPWTRSWDGKENNILVDQKYLEEDPEKFIIDLKKYLDDPRYIHINGKPIIGIYEPKNIPKLERFINIWRETARQIGIGEIFVLNCRSSGSAKRFKFTSILDGEYEFPPRNIRTDIIQGQKIKDGIGLNYQQLIETERNWPKMDDQDDFLVFRGSMAEWDNSPRKSKNYHFWINFSVEKFYAFNKINIEWTRKNHKEENRFIFVNAWNEWGEGAYLEPDTKKGYALINSLSKAIYDMPYRDEENYTIFLGSSAKNLTDFNNFTKTKKVAVQVHLFYIDLIFDIVDYTNNIPWPFDLLFTIVFPKFKEPLEKYLSKYSRADHFEIMIVENKGRDVYPFLKQMKSHIQDYEYFCHIHTKKSLHFASSGNSWRNYLYQNLLGSPAVVAEIFDMFEKNEKLGLVFPQTYEGILVHYGWGLNRKITENLLKRLFDDSKEVTNKIIFPAGNMFWARTKSVIQVLEENYKDDEFPEEDGRIDQTIMHAIERIWCLVAKLNGYTYRYIRNINDYMPLFYNKSITIKE